MLFQWAREATLEFLVETLRILGVVGVAQRLRHLVQRELRQGFAVLVARDALGHDAHLEQGGLNLEQATRRLVTLENELCDLLVWPVRVIFVDPSVTLLRPLDVLPDVLEGLRVVLGFLGGDVEDAASRARSVVAGGRDLAQRIRVESAHSR